MLAPGASEGDNQNVGSSTLMVNRQLGPGNRTFLQVASMVVTWWILAFCIVICLVLKVLDNYNDKMQ